MRRAAPVAGALLIQNGVATNPQHLDLAQGDRRKRAVVELPLAGRGDDRGLERIYPSKRQWCRVEIYADSSDMDVPNGRVWVTIHKPDRSKTTVLDWGNILTHNSDCCQDPTPVFVRLPKPWLELPFESWPSVRDL